MLLKNVFRKAVWTCLALACVAAPAAGQSPAGSIVGHVVDATGLALPGVTVTLQGADLTQTFTTDAEGTYRFLDLAPGSYKVTSALQEFTTNVREHIVVNVGQTVDLRLSPVEKP